MNDIQSRLRAASMMTEELGHSKSGMAYIGSFLVNNEGMTENYDVYVYANEGNLPHVHILNRTIKDGKPTFDCGVQLETNEYFPHGCHTSTMNERQRLAFYNFISSQNTNPLYNGTYYEKAVTLWNENNDAQVALHYRHEGYKDVIVPDYTK